MINQTRLRSEFDANITRMRNPFLGANRRECVLGTKGKEARQFLEQVRDCGWSMGSESFGTFMQVVR